MTDAISGNAHGAVIMARIPPRPLNLLLTKMAVRMPAPTENTTFATAYVVVILKLARKVVL